MRKASIIAASTVAVGAVLLLAFVLKERGDGVGTKQSLSPVYWVEKAQGRDLFDSKDRIWKKGVPDRKEVCLTIDDGPHPLSCQRLLDTLKEKKVIATFFVIGKQVDGNPDLVRRMVSDGHEIANHTYSHRRLDSLTREQVYDEVRNCDRSVEVTTDKKMVLFRPPGMRYNDTVLDVVKQLDHIMVHWTVGAKDFVGTITDEEMTPELKKLPKISPELIVTYVKKQLRNGAIILLHDNPITAEAMPKLIDAVRAEGYEFVSAKDMLAHLPQQVVINPNPPCGVGSVTR